MSTGDVSQGTNRWLDDLLLIVKLNNRIDQRVNAIVLNHGHLVVLIVAGQIRDDAYRTGDRDEISTLQELDQYAKQRVEILLEDKQ